MKLKFVLILVAFVNSVFANTLLAGSKNVFIESRMEKEQTLFEGDVYLNNHSADFEEVEELLRWFLLRLRSFILESQFKVSEFETYFDSLEKDLVDIQGLMDLIVPKIPDLLREFHFANYMFANMVTAVQITKNYNYWGSLTDYLLVSITEFNIGLLRLFDDYGEVNISLMGLADKVRSSSKNLCSWTEEFQKLVGISEESRGLFAQQMFKAKRIIKILDRSIPQV